MEVEGEEQEIDGRSVIGGKVDGGRVAGSCVLQADLLWSQLNAVTCGFLYDNVTDLVIAAESIKTDAGGRLGGYVAQVNFELEIGYLCGANLPADRENEGQSCKSSDEFVFPGHGEPMRRRSKSIIWRINDSLEIE